MCVGSPTAGAWSSFQRRPDDEFETDRLDTAAIRHLVDAATTADPRYTPSTTRREAHTLDTQARYGRWQTAYRALKQRPPADVRRVVRPAACQADSGGRLPGGHHPQTHDGKTGARHPARLTRRATGMGRPLSRRRRSGWWAGLPTEDRSINSHEETAPGDDGGANRPVGAQMFQVSLVDRNVYVY